MSKFSKSYTDTSPLWILKEYFDRMYEDKCFLYALGRIVDKLSFSTDGAYCNFPDMNSCCEEDHFEGVEFAYGYPPRASETIVVSEKVCSDYIKMVCEKYIHLHPEDASKMKDILDNLSF